MERAANDGDLDLEQEFKDTALKFLQELKEKHFEGTGTLLKKVPAFAIRAKEEMRPQGLAASVRPTSCGRRRVGGEVSKRRRLRKEESQDDTIKVMKSRRRSSTVRGSASVSRGSAAERERRRPFSSRGPKSSVRRTGAKRAIRGAGHRGGSKPAKRSSRA
eukprot:jgi/Antlo1/1660/2181